MTSSIALTMLSAGMHWVAGAISRERASAGGADVNLLVRRRWVRGCMMFLQVDEQARAAADALCHMTMTEEGYTPDEWMAKRLLPLLEWLASQHGTKWEWVRCMKTAEDVEQADQLRGMPSVLALQQHQPDVVTFVSSDGNVTSAASRYEMQLLAAEVGAAQLGPINVPALVENMEQFEALFGKVKT